MGKISKASDYFLEGLKPACFFLRGAKSQKFKLVCPQAPEKKKEPVYCVHFLIVYCILI